MSFRKQGGLGSTLLQDLLWVEYSGPKNRWWHGFKYIFLSGDQFFYLFADLYTPNKEIDPLQLTIVRRHFLSVFMCLGLLLHAEHAVFTVSPVRDTHTHTDL